jgi:aryl-alcohol dehydrogenase-like predicted oxidoreductase
LQPQYNLLERGIEWEVTDVCANEGLGMIPWSPLRGGWLSGKFQRGMDAPPAGTRIERAGAQGGGEAWNRYNNEGTWCTIDALIAVAEEAGKSPAQVAINWLLQRLSGIG